PLRYLDLFCRGISPRLLRFSLLYQFLPRLSKFLALQDHCHHHGGKCEGVKNGRQGPERIAERRKLRESRLVTQDKKPTYVDGNRDHGQKANLDDPCGSKFREYFDALAGRALLCFLLGHLG